MSDAIEDDPTLPGETVSAETGNADGDDVPDYADGYGLDASDPNDTWSIGTRFVPVVLTLPQSVNYNTATFKLDYDASDPAAVTSSTDADGNVTYTLPTDGSMRLWTQDSNVPRTDTPFNTLATGDIKAGESYYVPSTTFAAGQWATLLKATNEPVYSKQVVLWAEAAKPSASLADKSLRFSLDSNGNNDFRASNFVLASGASVSFHELLGWDELTQALDLPGGFDRVGADKWTLVPTGATNDIGLTISPAAAAPFIKVTTTNPAISTATVGATVVANNAAAIQVTVRGVTKSDLSSIQAEISPDAIPNYNLAPTVVDRVKVAVRTEKLVSVAAFGIDDPSIEAVIHKVVGLPSSDHLTNYLNAVFLRQAAVGITVAADQSINTITYDGMGQGGAADLYLQNPGNPSRQPPTGEIETISSGLPFENVDYKLYYVHAIEPEIDVINGQIGTPVGGWSYKHIAAIATWNYPRHVNDPGIVTPISEQDVLFGTAHELGHLLGLSHEKKPADLLMDEFGTQNPTRFPRLTKADWDILNP